MINIEPLEPRALFDAASPGGTALTAADVSTILAQAASQAMPDQAIVVVDRDGDVLGEYSGKGLNSPTGIVGDEMDEIILDAGLRARTAAYFESDGEAFTTRTARFIIQNNFPQGVLDTGGGPLYGVEFSSAAGTDVLPLDQQFAAFASLPGFLSIADSLNPAGLSGDPGGIPLYKRGIGTNGKPAMIAVGAIGVAGDFSDTLAKADLAEGATTNPDGTPLYAHAANPTGRVFTGKEQPDFDEAVALAGAVHYMAPANIRANTIFIDGLRLPFAAENPAHGHPSLTLADLLAAGDGTTLLAPTAATITPLPTATIAGVTGLLERRDTRANPNEVDQDYGVIGSNDFTPGTTSVSPDDLTAADVMQIITNAVATAKHVRAGIRQPIGVAASIYVTVVDADGDLLGAFAMNDATNFSYDVAVQKARTAAFFSDDTHAISTTALGFLAQGYFPPGINSGSEGPLYDLQDALAFAGVGATTEGSVGIIDDTLKPLGSVSAGVADPTTAVIPVSATGLSVGQIITFGDDSAHEYVITNIAAAGISVALDNIEPSPLAVQPLTAGESILPKNPLKNGITIFPGGEPLYKNGILVGAIGVSGDGVLQDDLISYSGAAGYRAPAAIQSDQLSSAAVVNFIGGKLQELGDLFDLGSAFTYDQDASDFPTQDTLRLGRELGHTRLPYVKFPRNPYR